MRWTKMVAGLLALGVLAVACGNGGDGNESTSPQDDPEQVEANDTAGDRDQLEATDDTDSDVISVDEFRERVGAACDAFYRQAIVELFDATESIDLGTGEPTIPDEEGLALRYVQLADQFVSDLHSIGAPEGQVAEWTEWIQLGEDGVHQAFANPAAVLANEPPDIGGGDRFEELSEQLRVPKECTERDYDRLFENIELDQEATAKVFQLIAWGMREYSGGLINGDETACIAEGLAQEFTLSEVAGLDESDADFAEQPPEQQAALFEIFTDCLPAEKLLGLGELEA